MLWVTPKTNWKEQDYFYLSDWLRITSNTEYITYLFGGNISALLDTTLVTTDDLPFYDLVNNLEENLQYVYTLYTQYTQYFPGSITHDKITWFPVTSSSYTRNPSYIDFNRWEIILLNLYDWWQDYTDVNANLISGNFYAGSNRTLQLLSRGR